VSEVEQILGATLLVVLVLVGIALIHAGHQRNKARRMVQRKIQDTVAGGSER